MMKHMANPESEAVGCIFEHKLSLPLPVLGGLSDAVDDAHRGLQIKLVIRPSDRSAPFIDLFQR